MNIFINKIQESGRRERVGKLSSGARGLTTYTNIKNDSHYPSSPIGGWCRSQMCRFYQHLHVKLM